VLVEGLERAAAIRINIVFIAYAKKGIDNYECQVIQTGIGLLTSDVIAQQDF
jgi:hypothetical protein